MGRCNEARVRWVFNRILRDATEEAIGGKPSLMHNLCKGGDEVVFDRLLELFPEADAGKAAERIRKAEIRSSRRLFSRVMKKQ